LACGSDLDLRSGPWNRISNRVSVLLQPRPRDPARRQVNRAGERRRL